MDVRAGVNVRQAAHRWAVVRRSNRSDWHFMAAKHLPAIHPAQQQPNRRAGGRPGDARRPAALSRAREMRMWSVLAFAEICTGAGRWDSMTLDQMRVSNGSASRSNANPKQNCSDDCATNTKEHLSFKALAKNKLGFTARKQHEKPYARTNQRSQQSNQSEHFWLP